MLSSIKTSVLYIALLVVLAGCISHSPPLPSGVASINTPRQVLVTEISPTTKEPLIWQVVVQKEGDSLRWLRLDLLGVPDARQILQNGQWRNDGFIMPNPKAQELFAALLLAWTKKADLSRAYGRKPLDWNIHRDKVGERIIETLELKENQQLHWTVTWHDVVFRPDEFSIENHANGIVWNVRPLINPPLIDLPPVP